MRFAMSPVGLLIPATAGKYRRTDAQDDALGWAGNIEPPAPDGSRGLALRHLQASNTGVPMAYRIDGEQCIVVW